jgi:hypothetical protein
MRANVRVTTPVTVLEEGFAWNGQTFGSLSQIARAMTGTTWNGQRGVVKVTVVRRLVGHMPSFK